MPLGTYGGELVSAMARELEREESALDGARRGGYCVFDRGIHDDVPDPGLVYLCSTYPAAVRLKDSLDSVRAQGNDPDCRTLGVYRVVDGYDFFIMGGLYGDTQTDAYADMKSSQGESVSDAEPDEALKAFEALMTANGIIIRSAFYYILLPSLFAMALPLLLYELLELHDRRRL